MTAIGHRPGVGREAQARTQDRGGNSSFGVGGGGEACVKAGGGAYLHAQLLAASAAGFLRVSEPALVSLFLFSKL